MPNDAITANIQSIECDYYLLRLDSAQLLPSGLRVSSGIFQGVMNKVIGGLTEVT